MPGRRRRKKEKDFSTGQANGHQAWVLSACSKLTTEKEGGEGWPTSLLHESPVYSVHDQTISFLTVILYIMYRLLPVTVRQNILVKANSPTNTTLLPSANTLIAWRMVCSAKYAPHTFTPIIKHLLQQQINILVKSHWDIYIYIILT